MIWLIYVVNFCSFYVFSQNNENSRINKLKQIIYTLSSDSLLGRESGSKGVDKAEKYLVKYYKEIGLVPFKGSYIQKFSFNKDSMLSDTAKNIVGIIENKADSTIIIGAHYDHIGLGGTRSRSLTSKKIHYGADDNASGVATMLMLALYLKESKQTDFNYCFIAFSAHEDGLFGSKSFMSENKLNNIKIMINLDMVGRLDTIYPKLKVIRNNKYGYLDMALYKSTHEKFYLLIISDDNYLSDATEFDKNNIPSISFTTGVHDDYHKVSDIAEKINYDGMDKITTYIISYLLSLKPKVAKN